MAKANWSHALETMPNTDRPTDIQTGRDGQTDEQTEGRWGKMNPVYYDNSVGLHSMYLSEILPAFWVFVTRKPSTRLMKKTFSAYLLFKITIELTFIMPILPAYPGLAIRLHAHVPEVPLLNIARPSAGTMLTWWHVH